ncbi:MAG: hypothetical protein EAZ16_05050 [Sphingobacteriales bacterium]|nr:MAG: hypothetical protein EAZ16_05050 [Sphingobacteriales bacterium]
MKYNLPLALALLFFLTACASNEIGHSKDVNPATIYTQYSITRNKGEDSIRCRAQYRFAGQNGTTLVLSQPAMVSLDEQQLTADSSEFEGAYYQQQFAAPSLKGTHYWFYKDINGKTFKEPFHLQLPICNTSFTDSIQPNNYTLSYQQLHTSVEITVQLSDSVGNDYSFTRKLSPQNNQLQIEPAFFDSLASGPVIISTYINQIWPLQNCPAEGGTFSLYYFIQDWQLQLVRKTN